MTTPADKGSALTQKAWWTRWDLLSLILGSIVSASIILAGAMACTGQLSSKTGAPEIVSFQGTAPGSEKDGSVTYTFEVKDATKIRLVEANETVKEIKVPISRIYKGTVSGRAGIGETSGAGVAPIVAILIASNATGTVQKTIDITPTASTYAVMRNHLSYGCGCASTCLTPEDASQQGLTVKLSDYVCGYNSDNVSMYCYYSSPSCVNSACWTEQQAAANGYSTKCREQPCGVTTDNITTYCYKLGGPECSPGCACLTPALAASMGFNSKCSEEPCEVTSDNITRYCYKTTCFLDCDCMTPDQAAAAGYNWKCTGWPCAVNTDNTTMYCYRKTNPCTPGCVCMTPEQASAEGLSERCSNDACGVDPDNHWMFCYKTACPCLPGCVCITPDQAISQGLSIKCSEQPCEVTSDNITKYCYQAAGYSCLPGCACLTPDQASAQGRGVKCSDTSCGITSDNVTEYCYSPAASCPFPCVCLTPDQASSQGFTMQCSQQSCGVTSDNITKYCYQDPSPCGCRGWKPITINWHGSAPETSTDLQCGDRIRIDSVTINTKITIISNPCSTGGCPQGPFYSYTVTPPPGSPPYPTVSTSIPEFSFTPVLPGKYIVVLNAACGNNACPPCTITIEVREVVTPPCSCIGWVPVLAHWYGNPMEGYRNLQCNSTFTIDEVKANTPIIFSSNPCSPDVCQVPSTYNWTITSTSTGVVIAQGDGLPAAFVPSSPGNYTVVLNASCSGNPCPTCNINIIIGSIVTPPCSCQGLSVGAVVSWGGSAPGTEHGICGGATVVIPSLTTGTAVQLSDAEAKCSYGCQPPTYSWTVTPQSGTPIQSGPGAANSFSFTPTSEGNYNVLIDASCGNTSCPPCTFTISIGEITPSSCSCQDWDVIVKPGKLLAGAPCGTTITLAEVTANTPVTLSANPCSSWPCEPESTYSWTVTPPTGPVIAWDGLPAAFVPTEIGTYTVTLNANCGGNPCTSCNITVNVENIVTPPCFCQGLSSAALVSWGGSSPGTGRGWCGADPVVIPSLTQGTQIQLSDALAKCADSCPPATYSWTITQPDNSQVQSGPGSGNSFSFTPASTGTYTVLVEASCGTTSCPPCSFPIQIDSITRKTTAGGSGIPFTCACGTWSPAIVTWPDGSQTVSCTPAAALPSVSIPSLTPGSAVQISSSAACGPGILNFFTGEACPASENWTVTSTFSGQGPWSGSGSTASFIPDKEGSFIVAFYASCGSAACPTPCKIHIDVKSMGQEEGGQPPSGAPVIISFTPSRTQVSPKEPVTLNWVIKGDGEATLECGGEKSTVPLTGSSVIYPAQSGCCTLTASNKYGSDQKTACITVSSTKESPPHINSFTASSTQVYAGDRVVLNWSISGDGEAYLTCGGEKRQVPFTGSSVISPTQSGCCTLSASNKAGSDQKSACITILRPKVTPPKETPPKPTAPVINNFSASCPKASFAAIACTLNWSVTGPSGTTVSISGLGSVGLSGSTQVKYGGSYTLTATSAGGSATRTVTVK